MTAPVASAGSDLRSFEDWVGEFNLLADESQMDIAQLQMALTDDLAPRTALEKFIVRDIIDLELERNRCRRWFWTIVMENVFKTMLEQAKAGGLKGKLNASKRKEFQRIWDRGDMAVRQELIERLMGLGIDPTTHIVRVQMKQSYSIAPFEDRLREIEFRRRRLYDDLVRLQKRQRPEIPDAVTLPS